MSSSDCPSPLPTAPKLQVDSVTFPPSVISPASSNTLFLGGAGVRGLEIQGKFVIFTVIGVYLDPVSVPSLSVKWEGKTTEELTESVPFFREIVIGAFEKFIKVTMKLPLTGQQYSEKVTENCVAIWKSLGIYTDSEAKAVERFLEVFKDETFPPGASILFALSPEGSLTVAFSKDDSIPETGKAVIENKLLAEAVLESIIGKNRVSPGARLRVAERLAQLMKENKVEEDATKTDQEEANDLSLAKEN
uniref:Chalcone--flavanone isomerase n=1 Tax=Raphanus sativus TaxID=3726 RepID=CFI_RAPSA|nr:RecName: Full=Chalcone--flavanone isomerase; Short=Chalcone isomerase [Raphanus sativus]AAB87071.1 chalcone isomerase [Raphanus sativus]